jgi:hypothetical protein
VTACTHPDRVEGICPTCGDCEHDLILNRACLRCGTTDLDPEQLSAKKSAPALIPADRLRRNR